MKSSTIARVLLPALLLLTSVAPAPTAGPAPGAPLVAPVQKLGIQEIRLENGLRIFVLERTASPTFAGYYQFGVGAASDPKGRTGIAHLLEHMMFKGTRAVGTLDADAEAVLMKKLSDLWHELDRELDRADDPFQKPDPDRVQALRARIEEVTNDEKKLIVKNEFDELMTRAGGESENASTDNDATNYYMELPSNHLEPGSDPA